MTTAWHRRNLTHRACTSTVSTHHLYRLLRLVRIRRSDSGPRLSPESRALAEKT